jgi:pSer/pThr/pTyr-binding forkhead associated (FHA) protein
MRVGRDSNCAILIPQPAVSSFHASVKLEGGKLLVKDERSNNGTFVGGVRIAAGHWTEVPHGGFVKFGPEEFRLRLE